MLKTTIALLTLATCAFTANAQNTFQKTYGTVKNEELWGLDLTSDGGYVLGGYTDVNNAVIVRLDANGDTLWSRHIDAGDWDLPYTIRQTSDGGFITAGRTSGFGAGGLDMLLIKIDANGNNQWTKAIGGTADETVNAIEQTNDGGFIIAGNTYSFSAGLNDFYVVKTDSAGNILWSKTIGGSGNDNAYSVIQTSAGDFMAVGLTTSAGEGIKDVLAVKMNASGTVIWTKTYGGSGDDRANSVVQTTDGGFAMAGVTNTFGAGNYDMHLIKTDTAGNLEWTKTYGGTADEWAYSLQQTDDDGYILAGYSSSFGAGGYDYYLLKTNAAGELTWSKTYGDSLSEFGTVVRHTPDNGYIVAGYGQNITSTDYDFYLVKTDHNGNSFCNQTNAATIETTASPFINAPTFSVSSGGTVSNGNPLAAAGINISSICTHVGIQSPQTESVFTIYPNPFQSSATLNFENSAHKNFIFSLYDTQGRLQQTIQGITSETIQIERKLLNSGLYFFQVRSENEMVANGKLLVE